MKYSYPDSLISLTAAIAQACSLYSHKQDDLVEDQSKDSARRKLKTNKTENENRVGIKFDNILTRKYFVLIHTTQEHIVLNNILEKPDDSSLTERHVTPVKNEWVKVNDRNGSSAGCQTTFLKTTS